MTDDRMALIEAFQKADDGNFLRSLAEPLAGGGASSQQGMCWVKDGDFGTVTASRSGSTNGSEKGVYFLAENGSILSQYASGA